MIKILFFIPDLSGGGAEKVLCNLVNNMDQSQFDITVQTVKKYDPQEYLGKGIHYKSILHSDLPIVVKLLTIWYRLCTEFKLTYPLYIKDDYDIEIAYLECGATKVMAASTNKEAKKIAWVHCDVKKKGLTAKKTGKYYKHFDQVVCVSEASKKNFDDIFSDFAKSIVIYNVIDEAEIYRKVKAELSINWNLNDFHIVTVGRLCFEKGCDRLVEVCKLLRDSGYSFKMHLIGDGPEYNVLNDEITSLKLSKYIVLEGYATNPYPYMNKADLIVIPSRTEALCTVAIESLILGKVVVTTPCSGMSELFGKSEYGIITEDSADSIFYNIKRLIDSPELFNKYSLLAKKRGLDFHKKEIVKRTEQFFEQIVKV